MFKKSELRLKQVPRGDARMISRLETLPHERKLKELGLFSLKKGRLKGDMIVIYRYTVGGKHGGRRKVYLK